MTAVGESGIGICCSGGGIRSAAYNLGALQALDEAGVLRRADYLSAVSGGSFIASAYAVAGRYSTAEALEVLTQVADDKDLVVRNAVSRALRESAK